MHLTWTSRLNGVREDDREAPRAVLFEALVYVFTVRREAVERRETCNFVPNARNYCFFMSASPEMRTGYLLC